MPVKKINELQFDWWDVDERKDVFLCEKGVPICSSPRDQILKNYLEKIGHRIPSTDTHREIAELKEEIRSLKVYLKLKVKAPQERIKEVRNAPIEQVKKEMLELLSDGKTRFFDEIAGTLNLDIKKVVQAFNELNSKGELFVDEQHKV